MEDLKKYGYCKQCYGLFPIDFLTPISIVENVIQSLISKSHINYESESGSYLCNNCMKKIKEKTEVYY